MQEITWPVGELGHAIAIIPAYAPGRHMWASKILRAQQYKGECISPQRVQCHAKHDQETAESFSTLLQSYPCCQTSFDPPSQLSYEFTLNVKWIIISCNIEHIFCVQDFHFQISQVEYWNQTRYTWILASDCQLWSIHIINLNIDWAEIFSFDWEGHWPQKSENSELEILDRSLRSSHGWLTVTKYLIISSSRLLENLWIENSG